MEVKTFKGEARGVLLSNFNVVSKWVFLSEWFVVTYVAYRCHLSQLLLPLRVTKGLDFRSDWLEFSSASSRPAIKNPHCIIYVNGILSLERYAELLCLTKVKCESLIERKIRGWACIDDEASAKTNAAPISDRRSNASIYIQCGNHSNKSWFSIFTRNCSWELMNINCRHENYSASTSWHSPSLLFIGKSTSWKRIIINWRILLWNRWRLWEFLPRSCWLEEYWKIFVECA